MAILFLTVYVGAICILFLFVVMMLNLRIVELYNSIYYHVPVSFVIILLFVLIWTYLGLFDYMFEFYTSAFNTENLFFNYFNVWLFYVYFDSNLVILGQLIYNYCLDLFFLASLVLVVAMIGVIVLTIDFRYMHIVSEVKSNYYDLSFDKDDKNLIILSKLYQLPWNYREFTLLASGSSRNNLMSFISIYISKNVYWYPGPYIRDMLFDEYVQMKWARQIAFFNRVFGWFKRLCSSIKNLFKNKY